MKKIIIFSFLMFYCLPAAAQEISGYVGVMPSFIAVYPGADTHWQTLVHNRLNFGWQITPQLRADIGMRNRFIAGSQSMIDPQAVSMDPGAVDLSWNWAEGKNALANTSFDRLFVTFEKNEWKLQIGRQRINWGQTFVWNPNDIFNTHSFFDFDYPERPGADALRATYYHNATSLSELAVSVNFDKKITSAFLHRWNSNNIDYQLIAGQLTETDLVLGGAVTSDIGGINIRSELSYFYPIDNQGGANGVVAVSLGADRVFSNSLMLQAEALYNSSANNSSGGLLGLYAAPLSAKQLSVSEWNIFAQASYPLTQRINGSLSGMYFVDIKSYYAGISLDRSVAENLDLSFIVQYFASSGNDSGNTQMLLGFTRLKYSF